MSSSGSPAAAGGDGTMVSLPPRDRAPSQDAIPPAPAPTEPQPEIEEDLLRDVLDELDKERTKRAQVEADFRHLSEEKQALERQITELKRAATPKEEVIVSRQAFVAMEAQVKGFKQLVDALTLGKPAIAAAAKQSTTPQRRTHGSSRAPVTLPLHVVRLLEVLPWDPRAVEHIFGREVIYEWQVYDAREKRWHSQIRQFPARLKNLPITKPKPDQDDSNSDADRSLLHFLAGSGEKAALLQSPSKHGVLTDMKLTQILKIEAGYPLPQDGGRWEWVGGWRVDKRIKETHQPSGEKQTIDCDDDGWSYGNQVQDFEVLPTELVWDNPGERFDRRLRRRKWSRQRVLVDYPFASERTKQYLKLLAENARLTITATKMSDQLVETKTKLTESEEALMQLKSEKMAQVAKYTEELKQQEELFKAIDHPHGATTSGGPTPQQQQQQQQQQPIKRVQDFLQNNDQVKELGSKISQWVARKTSDDKTAEDKSAEVVTATTGDSADNGVSTDVAAAHRRGSSEASIGGSSHGSESGNSNNPFWRKVGRGALIEKLAGKKNNPGRYSTVKLDDENALEEVAASEEEETSSLKEESGN